MGIDVAWVSETNQPKQEVFDPRMQLTRLVADRWHTLSSSVCLRFIDPFGDAVFNQAQIPELLRELEIEAGVTRDSETRAHLEKVVRLVGKSVGQTHTYIKFTGD
jgi:hypothetical protein